jgi:RimJ/RimL family protein N-acetyltransferase
MNRQIYNQKSGMALLYAENTDRRLIYDMAFEEEAIWRSMIENKEDFPWSVLRDEEPHFFGAAPGMSKYLLIELDKLIIGSISHTFNDGKIPNMELDMWLRSSQYAGKGLGSKAMKLLIDSLIKDYGIKTFIIRPWIKNQRAVRAYEKCGFMVEDTFNPDDYYGKYLEVAAQGDFGLEGTVNMVLTARKTNE